MLGLGRRKKCSIRKEGGKAAELLSACHSVPPPSLLLLREKGRANTFFLVFKHWESAALPSTFLFRGIIHLFLLPCWWFPLRTKLLNDLYIWVANRTEFL